jgi:hypothetical protein
MKPVTAMTDDELGEAILELAAPRVRLAAPEDLRKIADMLATFAVEAAARMKERGELVDVAGAGRRVLEAIARGDQDYGAPPTLEGGPGPLMGRVRNVVLHADGRLTCELTVNDAGARFVEQITRGGS